jgi:ligand-binding sensor domain-containing protein
MTGIAKNLSILEKTVAAQDIVYALTQTDDAIFAARASGLYRSNDTKNWHNALATLELNAIAVTDVLSVNNQLFASTTGGILQSDDGETWQAIPFRKPLPTLSAFAVSTNFTTDKTLFAASLEDGVFHSENEGKNWTAWNIGLLDLHVLSLTVTRYEHIYAGTETGLFISKTSGRSWQAVSLPFEYDAILSLLSVDNVLYIGTENHGLYCFENGTWEKLQLPNSGAVNKILSLPNQELLVLVDDILYFSKGAIVQVWKNFTEVSSIALTPQHKVLIGFNHGDVKVEDL